jgi:hypothetical protein
MSDVVRGLDDDWTLRAEEIQNWVSENVEENND